jgi:hemolysin activation/secretion protein
VHSLYIEGGYKHRNLYTDVLNSEFTKDKIRSVFTTLSYDYADQWDGTNLFSLTIDKGLTHRDATKEGSLLSTRPEARPNYIKLSGNLAREQGFTDWCSGNELCNKFSLFFSTNWQWANEPLFSSEEFSVGGRSFVKAYDLGEIAGDKGIAANIELHYKDIYQDLNYDLYTFFDAGTIRNLDEADKGTDNERKTIRSFGVGVNMIYNDWSLALEFAKPLADTPSTEKDKNIRSFAQINYKF